MTSPPSLYGIQGGGTVEFGQKVTLTVVFYGGVEGLSFQWAKANEAIAGATTSSYVIDAAAAADAATYTVTVSNSAGSSAASTDITVKSAAPPVITRAPDSLTCQVGQRALFDFVATGSHPRTHQWRKDGVDLQGATAATYTISAVASADAGSYSVVVNNSFGSTTSVAATLTVNAATPVVLPPNAPSDLTVTQGVFASLSVYRNSGSEPITYQWMKNGVAIAGATSDWLEFHAVALSDAGKYSVIVTNPAGSVTSREATVTVKPAIPVTIKFQPVNQTIYVGQAANFGVSATGTSPLTFQWKKDGSPIAGETGSSYSIARATLEDAGAYSVVVTNIAGSATSTAAILTVNPAVLPTIQIPPSGQDLAYGDTLSLSVRVMGSNPISYQWMKDGVALAGANGLRYNRFDVKPEDGGVYTVVVTNPAGSVTSEGATVTVRAPVAPAITKQPAGLTVAYGASATLRVETTGSPPMTYQWKKDGAVLNHGNSASFAIDSATPLDSGSFTVVITNPVGSVTSEAATLTVLAVIAPTITRQPQDQTVAYRGTISLSVQVAGSPPQRYQWQKDGVSLGSAGIWSSLWIYSATPANSGSYSVTVTNPGGAVTSQPATVTVHPAAVPTITRQPAALQLAVGLSASLRVEVGSTDTGSLSFQWRKNGVVIPGADADGYYLAAVKLSDAGDYSVVVTGDGGSVASAMARLTVLPLAPPVVDIWPASDRTVTLGQSESLSALLGVKGSPPFTYQWFKNGVAIPSRTDPILQFPSLTADDLGIYMVTISNAAGVIASPPIRLRPAPGSPGSPLPWADCVTADSVVYFLFTSPARIDRYDLVQERWLNSVTLSQTPTAFVPAADGVYLAYGRTLVLRSLDLATETAISNVTDSITHLFAFDEWVYYRAALSGYSRIRRSGPTAAGATGFSGNPVVGIAAGLRKMFLSSTSSRTELLTWTIAADGNLTEIVGGFDPGDFAVGSRVFVAPNEQWLATSAGTVFRTSDAAYVRSLGETLTDLAFFSDGTPVALRDAGLALAAPDTLFETARARVATPGARVFTAGDAAFVFGAPASGATVKVTKVARSEFAAASPGQVTPAPARYSVDDAFLGVDGIVNIFSRSQQGMVRWSTTTQSFLATRQLRAPPLAICSQPGAERVLLGYLDGQITELPLGAAMPAERQVAATSNLIKGVLDLGDRVLANVEFAFLPSESIHVVFGPDGTLDDVTLWNWARRHSPNLLWQAPTRRIYFATTTSGGYSTLTTSGTISSVPSDALTGASATPPLRIDPEGKLIATGNGRVFNADLTQVGVLGNNLLDAAWLPSDLYTLRTVDGETEIQQWARTSYLLARSVRLPGAPVRLFRLSDAQLLAVTALLGVPAFTVLNADLSVASSSGPRLTVAVQPQTAAPGSSATFAVSTAGGAGPVTYHWMRDGVVIAGAGDASLALPAVQSADCGLYTGTASDAGGVVASEPAILGLSSAAKVVGAGAEIGPNITHPNGRIFDQVRLDGVAASITADAGQVTRMSCTDLNGDIVQVEFAGAGTLSLVLSGSSGPAEAERYHQPGVNYMKGHGAIVITGADETTNLSVFSVGRANAVNQALFRPDVSYDGVADLAYIAILSSNGKFGGLRCANTNFFAAKGLTGLYAPGVRFTGPVYVGEITAFDDAAPTLILGSADGDTLITGGDLAQPNGRAVQVNGLTRLKFVSGTTSHGGALPAQLNQARLEQSGVDVTAQIVVNPTP